MKITVLGSGDTRGTPKLGCFCPVCSWARENGFERRRFGLIVESESTRVLVDASPDLRSALLERGLAPKDFDAVLLSHEHFDHVAGLGEFSFSGKSVPLFARPAALKHLFSDAAYGYLQDFKTFQLKETKFGVSFQVGPFKITPLEVDHSIETQGFLVEAEGRKVGVLTDTRANVLPSTLAALEGVDLLLTDGWLESRDQFRTAMRFAVLHLTDAEFESEFSRKKLNHLLIPQAKALGRQAGAKKTVALHVSHAAGPHDALSKAHDSASFQIGFDGLTLTV